jgi:nucleoid-associated protein YgaU
MENRGTYDEGGLRMPSKAELERQERMKRQIEVAKRVEREKHQAAMDEAEKKKADLERRMRMKEEARRLRAAGAKKAEKKVVKHVVAKGETLSHIAKKHYGKAGKWPTIYEANKDVIGSNPDIIRTGMELVIPELEE